MMLSVILLSALCGTFYVGVSATFDSVTVFVNHVELFKGDNNSNIEYRYFNGDTVDLICSHVWQFQKDVLLSYDYVDKRLVDPGPYPDISITGFFAGLRLTLQGTHDRSNVTCKFSKDYSDITVKITFILEHAVNDVMNLKINSLAVRPQDTQDSSKYIIYFTRNMNVWSEIEYKTLESATSSNDIVLESYQYSCGHREQVFDTSTSASRMVTNYSTCLIYEARNKTTMLPIRTVDIRFEEVIFNDYADNNLQLIVDGAYNDDMIELYKEKGEKTIYINYEEEDSVTLNCKFKVPPFLFQRRLELDGILQRASTSLTKHMVLTAQHNGKSLECKNHGDSLMGTIRVQFRQITPSTIVTPSLKSTEFIKILVNRAKIYEGNNHSNIEYRYLEGDKVDVTCVGIKNICPMSMTYYYVDEHLVDEDTANMSLSADRSRPGVGLRVTLHAAHNGSYVSCKCLSEGIEASAKLTFIFDSTIKDIINLKIYGLSLRPQNTHHPTNYTVYYLRHELIQWPKNVSFDWNVTNDDAELDLYRYHCNCSCQTPIERQLVNSTNTSPIHISEYDQGLMFYVHNKTSRLLLHNVDIRFEEVVNYGIDRTLTLNALQDNNNMIELYTWDGDGLIYYNYRADESVRLRCYASYKYNIYYAYTMVFDGTAMLPQPDYIGTIQNIQLTAADNNRTLDCSLLKNRKVVKNKRILFRNIAKAVTTSTDTIKADFAATDATPVTAKSNK